MIVRPQELSEQLKVSRTTLWRWVRAGKFPKPIRLGENSIAFLSQDVESWLSARKQEAETKHAA